MLNLNKNTLFGTEQLFLQMISFKMLRIFLLLLLLLLLLPRHWSRINSFVCILRLVIVLMCQLTHTYFGVVTHTHEQWWICWTRKFHEFSYKWTWVAHFWIIELISILCILRFVRQTFVIYLLIIIH